MLRYITKYIIAVNSSHPEYVDLEGSQEPTIPTQKFFDKGKILEKKKKWPNFGNTAYLAIGGRQNDYSAKIKIVLHFSNNLINKSNKICREKMIVFNYHTIYCPF